MILSAAFLKEDRLERLRVWLPIALSGLLVLIAGSDLFSWANTGPLTRPIFEWFYPERTDWGITVLTFRVRKVGHVVVYGVVAVLVVRVVVSEFCQGKVRASLTTLGVVALLAFADETLQALRPNRSGELRDVALDIEIAALALLFYWWIKRVRELRGTDNDLAARSSSEL